MIRRLVHAWRADREERHADHSPTFRGMNVEARRDAGRARRRQQAVLARKAMVRRCPSVSRGSVRVAGLGRIR